MKKKDLRLDESNRSSELAETRPVVCSGVPHGVDSDGKVRIERNCVSLSLLMPKNLKLKKVIKCFIPEPEVVFRAFRIPMFMNICERFPYPYE